MNYQDLLYQDKIQEEDKKTQTEIEANKLIEENQRKTWLAIPYSKSVLRKLENQSIELNFKALRLSPQIGEVSHEEVRALMIETLTINKILNLIKYGQYVDTVTDGNK